MMSLGRVSALAAAAVALGGGATRTAPDARLQVRGADGTWRTWWSASSAPARWAAPSAALEEAVRWRGGRPGLETGELALAANGGTGVVARVRPALKVRVILARLDPAKYELRLHAASRSGGGAGPWDLDQAPPDAALAVNGGQFTDAGPWGWVVHHGRALQAPGAGPLSAALVVDARGGARIVPADSLPALHAELLGGGGTVREAVQSYPALLDGDGGLPAALREPGRGVDLEHRDARLAACELRDGRLLLALTRFDGAGETLGAVPLGLTVPETAALMGGLGCRRAMMLDGGLSAQLLVRDASGGARRWDGLRKVPLGIVATERR